MIQCLLNVLDDDDESLQIEAAINIPNFEEHQIDSEDDETELVALHQSERSNFTLQAGHGSGGATIGNYVEHVLVQLTDTEFKQHLRMKRETVEVCICICHRRQK
ncbi:Uncharacterised protein r2_g2129 [Pycnogonum litorale]